MPEIESSSNQGGVGQWIIQSGGNSDVILPATVPKVQVEIEDADKWIISVMEDGGRKSEANPFEQKKLQKVIPELRNNKEFEGCYDPKIVSFGPYHHGKPELQEAEKLKAAVAFDFINHSGMDPQEFYKKIVDFVVIIRDCYLPGSTDAYDDVAFARMMFLDGCFLLGFIDNYMNRGMSVVTMLGNTLGSGRLGMFFGDFILLENQLPFLVIQALMSIRYRDDEGEKMIDNFLHSSYAPRMANKKQESQDEQRQPLHLLELVRQKYLSHSHHKANGGRKKGKNSSSTTSKASDHSFGSAIELKAKGIHFKSSGISCLTDISFTSSFGYGQLTLPPIVSSHQSKVLFLNMMAHELAPNTSTGWEVCSYIYFMNSLISGADDVIELRSHNIIYNFLDSNEGVAKFFNTMASAALFPNFDIIEDVCDQIEEHYNSKTKTWVAQVLHDHFSTPWAALAFLAALLVIFLTSTQTYFQVFPRPAN
ncbi:unnamed protein product [Ilex paraguariensis]|uniref:Uncharacterized protein n=1 Tax=Ilex paraguariensis TaxID=185542 RepID=A0ABC8UXY6_9AQUA